jgi:F-type H+-transporting ATPase subunit b
LHSMILAQTEVAGRVFGLDTQAFISIVIQLFNGILLAVVLGRLFYKPVKEFLQKRSDNIRSKIESADKTMDKANELIAEYEKKFKEIEKQRLEVMEAALQSAAEESKKILEEARKEANEIKRRSLESVAEDKKRLNEEARLYIIEVASKMAEKYVSRQMDDETQDKLFQEALAKLEDAQWIN